MTNRLDSILVRTRKNIVRDLALAAFLPMAVLFSGAAVGAELPKLNAAPRSIAPTELVHTASVPCPEEGAPLGA
jgi:hypothetical protein